MPTVLSILGVPIIAPPSASRNVNLAEHFTPTELARWEGQAQELNLQGKGDQVGFWLSR